MDSRARSACHTAGLPPPTRLIRRALALTVAVAPVRRTKLAGNWQPAGGGETWSPDRRRAPPRVSAGAILGGSQPSARTPRGSSSADDGRDHSRASAATPPGRVVQATRPAAAAAAVIGARCIPSASRRRRVQPPFTLSVNNGPRRRPAGISLLSDGLVRLAGARRRSRERK